MDCPPAKIEVPWLSAITDGGATVVTAEPTYRHWLEQGEKTATGEIEITVRLRLKPLPEVRPEYSIRPEKEWAEVYGITERSVPRWFKSGNGIRARKFGRAWGVDTRDIPRGK
jgi:hypothetical protein